MKLYRITTKFTDGTTGLLEGLTENDFASYHAKLNFAEIVSYQVELTDDI